VSASEARFFALVAARGDRRQVSGQRVTGKPRAAFPADVRTCQPADRLRIPRLRFGLGLWNKMNIGLDAECAFI